MAGPIRQQHPAIDRGVLLRLGASNALRQIIQAAPIKVHEVQHMRHILLDLCYQAVLIHRHNTPAQIHQRLFRAVPILCLRRILRAAITRSHRALMFLQRAMSFGNPLPHAPASDCDARR